MLVWGEKTTNKENLKEASSKVQKISTLSINDIIEFLDRVGKRWEKEQSLYKKAKVLLKEERSFSEDLLEESLLTLVNLLSKDNLLKRVQDELGNIDCLDDFSSHLNYQGKIKYQGKGVAVHITAGNVFLGMVDSFITGLLSKNVNIIKVSKRNEAFAELFIDSLISSDPENKILNFMTFLSWKGGDKEVESEVVSYADIVIAWGAEDVMNHYHSLLKAGQELLEYGPKISFQVIAKKQEEKIDDFLAELIVKDFCYWDQAACSNSQVLFLEKGMNVQKIIDRLKDELLCYDSIVEKMDDNEIVEHKKSEELSLYSEYKTGIKSFSSIRGNIHYSHKKGLTSSPLNRTLIVKEFGSLEDLSRQIFPYRKYLQTTGLACSGEEFELFSKMLSSNGVKRITSVGKMTEALEGSPHDGSFSLSRLVNFIPIEENSLLDVFLNQVCNEVPFYSDFKGKELREFPLIDGQTLIENGINSKSKAMINKGFAKGHIFASGGTTGKSKYSVYSYEEFDLVCQGLAKSYRLNGLKSGSVVANLFVAGNMWSSFTAVQKALEHCDVIQLPIGGQVCVSDFKKFVDEFMPSVIFGLPGQLATLAKETKGLSIEQIFYAGEGVSSGVKKVLEDNWGVKKISSAGYASVDAGPIGYQDPLGELGEHIMFDHIYMEEIEGECIVTSTLRKSMPIIRYKTSDKVLLLGNRKFKLLGRTDETIFIWGARIKRDEFKKALYEVGVTDFQVIIRFDQEKQADILEVRLNEVIRKEDFLSRLLKRGLDLSLTVEESFLDEHLLLNDEAFILSERTSKKLTVIDQR